MSATEPAYLTALVQGVLPTAGWNGPIPACRQPPGVCTQNAGSASMVNDGCCTSLFFAGVVVLVLSRPYDTGDYVCGCDSNFTSNFCQHWTNETSCTKFWYCHWNASHCMGGEKGANSEHQCVGHITSGTMDHFAHLLEPYAGWYHQPFAADRIALLLGRMLLPWHQAPNFTAFGAILLACSVGCLLVLDDF